jgi:hypothetical protein
LDGSESDRSTGKVDLQQKVQDILLRKDDTNLDHPVDLELYEEIKLIRSKLKNKNKEWFTNFKRAHKREATKQDYKEIADQVNEFNLYNKKYILMKAKVVRQGLIENNFTKARSSPQGGYSISENFGASLNDPSLKKMKNEMQVKEKQNQELQDEIRRLKHRMHEQVGDNDIH